MQYLKTEQEINNEKTEKHFDCIKKACEALHACSESSKKAEKARQALKSEDKMEIWNVLQEYLREYGNFINSTTGITGVEVYHVDENFYNASTIADVKRQIKGVIAFVYLKEAIFSVGKQAIRQKLKSLLKETKIFNKKELSLFD